MESDDENNKELHWNEKIENNAKKIAEICKSYKALHIQESQNSMRIYNVMTITGIILGPLSGLVSGIGALINPETDPLLPIISAVCGFISGVVVTFIKVGKYDEVSNANKQASARYSNIENNVRRQLLLYRKDRVEPLKYMEWVENKYEEIFMSAPLISSSSYDILEDLNLPIPEQYSDTIIINVEERIQDNKEIRIKRGNSMSSLPEISNKMLEYEMRRMVK